jgi:hypothetical protein
MSEGKSPKKSATFTRGMEQLGSILDDRNIEALIKRIGDNFEKYSVEEADPKKHKVFWWEQICKHYYPEEWADPKQKNLAFKRVLGQTSKFTLGEIRSIFERSMRWRKNPPALFWKLVREKQAEIRRQIGKI